MCEDEPDEGYLDESIEELLEKFVLDGNQRTKGRPSKLDHKHLKPLIKYISMGNTFRASCIASGISYSVFASWVRKADKYLEIIEVAEEKKISFKEAAKIKESELKSVNWEFVNFMKLLNMAKMKAECNLVGIINHHAKKDFRAAAFILERRNRDEWGPKRPEETDAPEGVRIIIERIGKDGKKVKNYGDSDPEDS